MERVIPKEELKLIIKRLLLDPNRGISKDLFADVAGLDIRTIERACITGEYTFTEAIQRRLSRAYHRYVNGELAVMVNRDNTRFVTFRKEPKKRIARSNSIVFENGQVKVKVGLVNRLDYSRPTLGEQLERG